MFQMMEKPINFCRPGPAVRFTQLGTKIVERLIAALLHLQCMP